MGLIETLAEPDPKFIDYFFHYRKAGAPSRFRIRVSQSGKTITTGVFFRSFMKPDVRVYPERVPTVGFYGEYWVPRGVRHHAAVLEFGGSEGGLSGGAKAASLASAGYPTLDLAYFGEPHLPQELRDISLGYFAKALRWLGHQPAVDKKEIFVVGGSRGSQAALLIGAYYPHLVHGVIASSPNNLPGQSYHASGSSAWAYAGKPINPFVPIPVQRIRGPLLLDCGTYDQVWPSCPAAEAIMHRLDVSHDPYPHMLYLFRGAGHFVNSLVPYGIYWSGELDPIGAGRSPLANANADARLWPAVLKFLAGKLKSSGIVAEPSSPP